MTWFFWTVLGLMALLIPTAYAGKIGAPYAPTRLKVVRQAFDKLKIGPGDVLVDLGAGDGSIVKEAGKRGATAMGYELSPIMWLVAFLRTWRLPKTKIYWRNFYKQQFPQATIVFAFLMPANMPRVRQFLEQQEMSHGRYFLSYMFPLKNVEPVTTVRAEKCGPIYVYDLQELQNQKAKIKTENKKSKLSAQS